MVQQSSFSFSRNTNFATKIADNKNSATFLQKKIEQWDKMSPEQKAVVRDNIASGASNYHKEVVKYMHTDPLAKGGKTPIVFVLLFLVPVCLMFDLMFDISIQLLPFITCNTIFPIREPFDSFTQRFALLFKAIKNPCILKSQWMEKEGNCFIRNHIVFFGQCTNRLTIVCWHAVGQILAFYFIP